MASKKIEKESLKRFQKESIDNEKQNKKWAEIALSFIKDVLPVSVPAVYFTLKMADHDLPNRNQRYSTLEEILFSEQRCEIASIIEAVKEFSLDIRLEVMPFIQFCLKSVEKWNASKAQKKERKLQLLTLKNSWIIKKHFDSDH